MTKFLEKLTFELAMQLREPDQYRAGLWKAFAIAYEVIEEKNPPINSAGCFRWLAKQVEGTTAEAVAILAAETREGMRV